MIIQSTRVWIEEQWLAAQIEVEGKKIKGVYPYNTKIVDVDYGDNRIYPGFIDTHCHGAGGFDTNDAVEDGLKAWKLLTEGHYDIILTDWNMPNMNGLELVKKVRSEGTHQKTPIIMITTEGGKGEVITALKAGVNNYIVKPFNAEVLKEKLDGVIKK